MRKIKLALMVCVICFQIYLISEFWKLSIEQDRILKRYDSIKTKQKNIIGRYDVLLGRKPEETP